jgi:hypothetical protein
MCVDRFTVMRGDISGLPEFQVYDTHFSTVVCRCSTFERAERLCRSLKFLPLWKRVNARTVLRLINKKEVAA